MAVIRKRLLPAQKLVVLLFELAHNILIWARSWLGEHAPRLLDYGIVRLIGQIWAIPGRSSWPNTMAWYASACDGNIPELAMCAKGFCPCFSNGKA